MPHRPRLSIVRLFVSLSIASLGAGLPPTTLGATVTLVGAGDIAMCGKQADEATAVVVGGIAGTVFTAGDNAYPDGTATDFEQCYAPSWGAFKSRTRPAPGNHEYHTAGAPGYFGYFGALAGADGLGYYAYDLGDWRVYSLNSEAITSGELAWLSDDLAANPRQCSLAYWHEPLFSSGQHGNDTDVRPFWDLLYAAGTELIINGHDHDYERFAPQSPTGVADPAHGIRELVVGTGGAGLRGFTTLQPNSEVRNSTTNGVIELTLTDVGYTADFRFASGQQFTDSFSGSCHDAPATEPPPSSGANLLVNGEFESVNGGELPAAWTQDPRFTRSSSVVHAGAFAGRHFAADNSGYKISQDVKINANQSYAASAYVNVPTTADAFKLIIKIQWRAGGVLSTVTVAKYTKPTAGWISSSRTVQAPNGATSARIMMVVSSLNAVLFVDSFELTGQGSALAALARHQAFIRGKVLPS